MNISPLKCPLKPPSRCSAWAGVQLALDNTSFGERIGTGSVGQHRQHSESWLAILRSRPELQVVRTKATQHLRGLLLALDWLCSHYTSSVSPVPSGLCCSYGFNLGSYGRSPEALYSGRREDRTVVHENLILRYLVLEIPTMRRDTKRAVSSLSSHGDASSRVQPSPSPSPARTK